MITRIRLYLPALCVLVMSTARLWPITADQPVQAHEAAVPTPAIVWLIATPTAEPTGFPVPTAEPQPAVVTYVEVTPVPWIAPTEPAYEPPPEWINDPAQNGGSTPPDGCTFPIINGACANGAQLVDAADGVRTNDRADRPHRIDPPSADRP